MQYRYVPPLPTPKPYCNPRANTWPALSTSGRKGATVQGLAALGKWLVAGEAPGGGGGGVAGVRRMPDLRWLSVHIDS